MFTKSTKKDLWSLHTSRPAHSGSQTPLQLKIKSTWASSLEQTWCRSSTSVKTTTYLNTWETLVVCSILSSSLAMPSLILLCRGFSKQLSSKKYTACSTICEIWPHTTRHESQVCWHREVNGKVVLPAQTLLTHLAVENPTCLSQWSLRLGLNNWCWGVRQWPSLKSAMIIWQSRKRLKMEKMAKIKLRPKRMQKINQRRS